MTKPFSEVLAEMQAMHDKKSQDYGVQADPFANVRASEDFGIPGWLGTIVRLNDKITRIKSFAKNGSLANESLRDSLTSRCMGRLQWHCMTSEMLRLLARRKP
jgi:hypothetical protein